MEKVLKWPLDKKSQTFEIDMPVGSIPLCVQVQDNQPVLYTRSVVPGPYRVHRFIGAATGETMPVRGVGAFIGTAMLDDGTYVVHYFEATA